MSHSLVPKSPTASPKPFSSTALKMTDLQLPASIPCFHQRRAFIFSLIGAGLGLSASSKGAGAAKRPPPPPLPTEKKDPNVSGVQAKVLASKKRKEAMKEQVARLREKGKSIS